MSLPAIALLVLSAAPEDLTCLKAEEGQPKPSALFYAALQKEAYTALDRRQAAYDEVQTPDQAKAYQQKLREAMIQQLGGFPERTPLNAHVIGQPIVAEGYRVERILFESQPGHHVAANLYLPALQPPFPAVCVASGHSRPGKAADYNQRFGIVLARNGIAALAYDPIGQGERSQILTAEGKPQFTSTTTEHYLVGVGSILVGKNTATYRVWDGMRAIDYLCSRPEINKDRIGFTGCSGGGTLTSYVMALDERVACAAPSCYLTTFRRLIETIGPQDAEQNIFGQLAVGLDQPDYVLLRAPQPTLISSTSGDFFDIQGSWDNYRQAKRFYGTLGFAERVDLVEAPGGHGVTPTNLTGIVRWMRRWLLDKDDAVVLDKVAVHPEADLRCTEKGQVLLLPGERSVFDLNVAIEKKLNEQRKVYWQKTPKDDALDAVRKLTGVRKLADLPPPTHTDLGRVQRVGYHIDKLTINTDSGVRLPALTYHPPVPHAEAYLYLHDGGKAADGAVGGPIEKLVNDGYVVVAVDLRGLGELGSSRPDSLLGDTNNFYVSYLLGKSLVGLQAEDALAGGHFVAYYKTKTPRKVHVVGVGRAGIAALHAAALGGDLFTSVTLRETAESWSAIVGQSVPTGQMSSTVHGALGVYDLPDLVRSLAPKKVTIEK